MKISYVEGFYLTEGHLLALTSVDPMAAHQVIKCLLSRVMGGNDTEPRLEESRVIHDNILAFDAIAKNAGLNLEEYLEQVKNPRI